MARKNVYAEESETRKLDAMRHKSSRSINIEAYISTKEPGDDLDKLPAGGT